MAIVYQQERALFQDIIAAEEAEDLLEWLLQNPGQPVDLADCRHLHAASLQVLMAAKPPIAAWSKNADMRVWLELALN